MANTRIYEILEYMPGILQRILRTVFDTSNYSIEEIRLRANQPLMLGIEGENCVVSPSGAIAREWKAGYKVTYADIRSVFHAACENSVYAYLEEIKQGFITLRGGHRVGFTGRAVVSGGVIENFREISSMNIRIAHEVLTAAEPVMKDIVVDGRVRSTLVIAPPAVGKTTMLRDITRRVSNMGFRTGVADDRGEIAAMYKGVPQNAIGYQTDVMDNAPKDLAVVLMLRSMAPQVIVTDELATAADVGAVLAAAGTGISMIASTHGARVDDVKQRSVLKPLFAAGVFEQAILLRSIRCGVQREVITDVVMLR